MKSLFIMLSLILSPFLALAQRLNFAKPDQLIGTLTDTAQVGTIIQNILTFFASLVFAISVFMFLYAGYVYMTAGDDEGAIEKAKSFLIWGIVGIVVALVSWSIPLFICSVISTGAGGASCNSLI